MAPLKSTLEDSNGIFQVERQDPRPPAHAGSTVGWGYRAGGGGYRKAFSSSDRVQSDGRS